MSSPQFAVIVHVAGVKQSVVELGPAKTTFGRNPHYAEVRLDDALVAKHHFDIEWNAAAERHEINDFGRYAVTINGTPLGGALDRKDLFNSRWRGVRAPLSPGDVIEIGACRLEYVALPQA